MKIYLNRKPVEGPWGGGAKTFNLLSKRLKQMGHEVVHELNHNNISLIFMVDPRTTEWGESYDDIYNYSKKYNVKIIQRVGDLGLHNKPHLTELLKKSIPNSHCVTYISDFAKNFLNINHSNDNVIDLAPLSNFYESRNDNLTLTYPIKIVTHHWSNNPKKGFDYYKILDEFISSYKDKIEFTYIGNVPSGFTLKNSLHIPPISVDKLVDALPKYDFYLSASVGETGGNHVLEAIGAGLPVLYHKDGGGIVNYCKNMGIEYESPRDMLEKISIIINEYGSLKKEVLKYKDTLESVVEKYIELITNEI